MSKLYILAANKNFKKEYSDSFFEGEWQSNSFEVDLDQAQSINT
jgi:hypothetical protein